MNIASKIVTEIKFLAHSFFKRVDNSFLIYNDSLATLTDLYQLTMAYGYWKNKTHEKNAVFHLFYRKDPFNGNYAICAGLEYVIHFLKNFHFSYDDLNYLSTLKGIDNQPLFEKEFLNYLKKMKFSCTVDAIPEGTVIFANEPLIRIKGPIIQCQLLETILLNIVNFQTLIATKASRVCNAAKGDRVVEFGLRRAQGIDGGISASRAAYIGGCVGTSNVLAGKLFGIPVIGTHAHSWVMSFPSEEEAFEAYAQAMPNNCVFLVDTYNTIDGIRNAIKQGLKLRQRGFEMIGIRLDSGDLAKLSIQARQILDEAGFPNAQIVASNDLDEYKIARLKGQGAKINSWGVGTQMVTAADQPALGGVYKLGVIEEEPGKWVDKIKLSNDINKVTNPGSLEVWRYFNCYTNKMYKDIISSEEFEPEIIVFAEATEAPKKLLTRIFDNGKLVYKLPKIVEIRRHTLKQMSSGVNFEPGFASVENSLWQRKQEMIKNYSAKKE